MATVQDYTNRVAAFVLTPNHPALSVGLVIFTLVGVLANLFTGNALTTLLALDPSCLFHLKLNNLSFYSMLHTGFFHWLINMLALFVPLLHFERAHGTVHTGITLNLLTVVAALQYCLVGTILFPHTKVVGVSGIVFLLMTFTAVKEHVSSPTLRLGRLGSRDVQVPTLAAPFLMLVLCSVLIPSSLFWGHLFGISAGYLLAKGYLKVLYPPSWVVVAIESRLARPIAMLAPLVVFYGEEDAAVSRLAGYVSVWGADQEQAALQQRPQPPLFPGQGRALNDEE